ncbi:MAG: hypothetical protein HQ596_03160 [Candidatus Saganbacteria bacterium]|nr:hypothetical protein [Candidatus Saganbacteria bacterium]
MEYRKPQLFAVSAAGVTTGICMNGDEGKNSPACTNGAAASGGGCCEGQAVSSTY